MKLHWIQHIPFEDLGYIQEIALNKGYKISSTKVYQQGFSFPSVDEFDLLVVMGGPMGVYDTDIYSWLADEKAFIKNAIEKGKKVLGICLGAQIIADVLGGRVYRNTYKEIGWYKLIEEEGYNGKLAGIFSSSPEVFHWHGDTFTLPEGCERICSSDGCRNQGFEYRSDVFGLQFHLETTETSAVNLIENCRDELAEEGKYIQKENVIMSDTNKFENINSIMKEVFTRIEGEM